MLIIAFRLKSQDHTAKVIQFFNNPKPNFIIFEKNLAV